MDVIQLRRNLLMMQQEEGYIKNGLVFHLDGINRGNTSGSWVDLIGSKTFELTDCTENQNNVEFNGISSYGICAENSILAQAIGGTIEICIDFDTTASSNYGAIFSCGSSTYRNQIVAFIRTADNYMVYDARNVSSRFMWANSINKGTISASYENCLANGTTITGKESYNSFAPNSNYYFTIGKRTQTNAMYYKGKIYAIRLYDRLLSADEMLHNQRVDNTRFSLGLTI